MFYDKTSRVRNTTHPAKTKRERTKMARVLGIFLLWTLNGASAQDCLDHVDTPDSFFPFGITEGDTAFTESDMEQNLTLPGDGIMVDSTPCYNMDTTAAGEINLYCGSREFTITIKSAIANLTAPQATPNNQKFYRNITDQSDYVILQMKDVVVTTFCDSTFEPTFAFLDTNVCRDGDDMQAHTFQTAIVGDKEQTFVIIHWLSAFSEHNNVYLLYEDYYKRKFFDFFLGTYEAPFNTDSNSCQPGRYVFKLSPRNLVRPLGPCVCPNVPPIVVRDNCPVCGGCGTQLIRQMMTDGSPSQKTITRKCPAVRCKIGVHPNRMFQYKKDRRGRRRYMATSRRCCYSWVNQKNPRRLPFPRRCKTKKSRGYE